MTRVLDLHKNWLSDEDYANEFAALGEEFALAEALISARLKAGLSQTELAERMHVKPNTIARLESGRTFPSTRLLKQIAEATGTRLRISFEQPPKETIEVEAVDGRGA